MHALLPGTHGVGSTAVAHASNVHRIYTGRGRGLETPGLLDSMAPAESTVVSSREWECSDENERNRQPTRLRSSGRLRVGEEGRRRGSNYRRFFSNMCGSSMPVPHRAHPFHYGAKSDARLLLCVCVCVSLMLLLTHYLQNHVVGHENKTKIALPSILRLTFLLSWQALTSYFSLSM